jgi:hypothetical protein
MCSRPLPRVRLREGIHSLHAPAAGVPGRLCHSYKIGLEPISKLYTVLTILLDDKGTLR